MKTALGIGLVLTLSGCATLRDVRLDHQLPKAETPALDLSAYKSVQERADGQDPELAVAAAMSGGGHRAANFAMGVLLALESFDTNGGPYDLLREIDYFSTVSGGGFAAGTYIASLYDHLRTTGGKRDGFCLADALTENNKRLLVSLERNYQGTIFESLLCLRCLGHRDAGDILERKLNRYVLGSAHRAEKYSIQLGDIFRAKGNDATVLLPYWAPNATVYENGARVPFTPDVLARYHVTGYTHNMKFATCGTNTFQIPLSVGIKASASFPVAFPATTLSCHDPDDRLNRFLHLMDGGLSDNSGYRTAIEFLKQDKAKRKVLLIIDAYRGISHPYSSREYSPVGFDAAYRTMKISLDGDRNRLRKNVDALVRLAEEENGVPIRVILLSFADLKPPLHTKTQDTREALEDRRKEASAAVGRRFQREMGTAMRREEKDLDDIEGAYSLYDDARAVPTSLSITRAQQRLLLKAGDAVVEKNSDLLRQYLTLEPPKDPQERHHGESKQEGVETRGPDPPPHSSQERT